MAAKTRESLQADIARINEEMKLLETRDEQVEKVLAVLKHFKDVLTPAQQRKVARAVGATIASDDAPVAKRAGKRATKKGTKTGSVAARYQIPDGTTWTGRGNTPKLFAAWSATSDGKAWHKANPDEKYPAISGGGASAGKATAKKASKKATKKRAKKAAASNG